MNGMRANRSLLGVLLLLLVVVLVPTAGVVWFMTAAMRNERAAVRETLTSAYRERLAGLAEQVEAGWERRRERLDEVGSEEPAAEAFASLVRAGLADSVVLYDERGRPRYPGDPPSISRTPRVESAAWREAQRLEFGAQDYSSAASAYERLARRTSDIHLAARALQARARSLANAGESEAAAAILTGTLTEDRFRGARDGQGRLVVPDSLLLAIHLAGDPASAAAGAAAAELRSRLEHYGEPPMPLAQRRFLMGQLRELLPGEPAVDTFAAEELAARYLDSEAAPLGGQGLRPSGLPGVWLLASTDGTVAALYREASVLSTVPAVGTSERPTREIEIELLPPGVDPERRAFLSAATGALLPGWRLALHLADRDLLDSAAEAEVGGYLWTGVLLIASVVLVAVVAAGLIGRQMRLAKLKNDLIATVTHELKTPLASMRLLVDTLLDAERHDEPQVREYLEMISNENRRLSRLIEDFLAFSRMERNKQAFEKVRVEPAEVAQAAAEAVTERRRAETSRLEVEIAPDLPRIVGDREALSTVIINLLDNAYKYSEDDQKIVLRAYSENGQVVFDVEDHGIGLSRRAAKRIFERFYQVDSDLSRRGSGVGLGLAIVKFIVDAHGGEVSVTSRAGVGSTFRVKLPAVQDTGAET